MSDFFSKHVDPGAMQNKWGFCISCGTGLLGCGLAALAYILFTPMVSMPFLAAIMVAGGFFILFDNFQFWWKRWSMFILHFIIGISYIILGFLFTQGPSLSFSLTLTLAYFFIGLGIYRMFYGLLVPLPKKGWRFANGVIDLILGIILLYEWPIGEIPLLALFLGVDLVFAGTVCMKIALSMRAYGRTK